MKEKVVVKLVKDLSKSNFIKKELERLKDLQCEYIVRYYNSVDDNEKKGVGEFN